MDKEHLNKCLLRLGIDSNKEIQSTSLNTDGSGAEVTELLINDEKFILKFTEINAGSDLVINARRERNFYENMVPEITVRVPNVSASFDDDSFGIGLLMNSYNQTPHPSSWNEALIMEAVSQIASLHASFWGEEEEIERVIGVQPLQEKFEYHEGEIGKSLEAWEHVYSTVKWKEDFPLEAILKLLLDLRKLEAFHCEIPRTLVHGDFHMENCLLSDDGKLILTDWQSPGVGSGPEEIGYFLARAELYGNPLLFDEIIILYISSLEWQVKTKLPYELIQQSVYAKRLFVHLFWSPRYVMYYPEDVLKAVLKGIIESAEKLKLIPETKS